MNKKVYILLAAFAVQISLQGAALHRAPAEDTKTEIDANTLQGLIVSAMLYNNSKLPELMALITPEHIAWKNHNDPFFYKIFAQALDSYYNGDKEKRKNLLRRCFELGANPNAHNDSYVARAVRHQNIDLLELLKEYGADLERPDYNGVTPKRWNNERNKQSYPEIYSKIKEILESQKETRPRWKYLHDRALGLKK